MKSVATICKASRQRGNALVLLLLVRTWEGEEPPTRDELAELAHISTRQAERDLLKLIEDGELEKVGRRGQVTRFQIKGLTHVSDGTDNQRTDTSDEQRTEVSDLAPVLPGVTVESAISDRPLSDSSDTSVRPFDGTKVAPLSAKNTSKNNPQPSVEADAGAPPAPPPSKAKKVRPSKADPRTSHPAIVAVFEVTGRRPDKDLYNKIIRTLGDEPDGQKLVECFEAWRAKGYRATNYGWITDWYVKGIPDKSQNGNGRKHEQRQQANPRVETILEYDYAATFDGPTGAEVGDADSEVPPDEWLEPVAPGRPNGDDRRLARSSRH
jgi:hypothetical protein